MCGIAGVVSRSGLEPKKLQKMSEIQKHRGPDDEGFICLDQDGKVQEFRGEDTIPDLGHYKHISQAASSGNTYVCGLNHRRLSIIDLSPSGHQPMNYQGRKCFISYNGEVYNYKELREELLGKGYSFSSKSDTEVILASYHEWGENCAKKFLGMWAFAILDLDKQHLFLSRDRFGIKPLYFVKKPNLFAFSSEIKALLELDQEFRKADKQNVCEYLGFGTLSDPYKTLYQDIVELPSGFNMVYDLKQNNYALNQYYDLLESSKSLFNGSEPLSDYSNLLSDSIKLHLRSDVPVGSCLSGGMDSSAIVAFSSPLLNGNSYNTFTAAYHDPAIDESYYAKMVNSHFHNVKEHFTYPTSSLYWQEIDKLVWHQDLPIGSTSMFASWEVMKLAAKCNMKVLLDGQGADESLGGYALFGGLFLLGQLKKGRMISFLHEARKLKNNRSIKVSRELGRAAIHSLPKIIKKKLFETKRIGNRCLAPDYANVLLSSHYPIRTGKSMKESCILSLKFGLHELLRYEDRNSMAFSIETRVPFLDHRLVELSLSLGDHWKIKGGWSKYVLRKTVEPFLPSEITWRKDKKGFITPQKIWKSELKKEISEFLNDYEFPEMLNKEYIKQLGNSCIEDSAQQSEFWRLLSFLKWTNIYKIKL